MVSQDFSAKPFVVKPLNLGSQIGCLTCFRIEFIFPVHQYAGVNRRIFSIILSLFVCGGALNLFAQGTAFNYQGRLNVAGSPANGSYDLRFAVYDAVTNGNLASVWLTNAAVVVSNGLFSATLNFGNGIFTGTNYWLDIAVRPTGETNFIALWPRQPVLPVPYAIFATTASNVLGTVSAAQLTGTVPSSQISGTYANPVSFSSSGNTFWGTFSGSGPTLSNLNASQLTSGTVADARLTTNVALLNASQTFSGSNLFTGTNNFYGVNTFTNRGNSFVGSFFGNGLVGWISVGGTATQAMANAGYLLLNPGLTTVTLPATGSLLVGDIVRISGAGAGGWLVALNSGQSILGNFASYRNGFLQSSLNGGDWRRLASSADGTRMYAGGSLSGGVYSSSDSGHTWNPTGITGSGWFSVACSADGSIVFAAPNGGSSQIQKSSNGGVTWAPIGSAANWMAIACSADGSKVIAAPVSGSLALSTGSSPASGSWTAVACSGDGTNLAAALGTMIYASTNAGYNWINTSLPNKCSALAAATAGLKLVAAYNGGIATSTNFGANWTTTSAGSATWNCLAGSSDCTRLVAGVSNGLFYASANFGATWTSLSTTNQIWSGAGISADGSKFAATVSSAGSTPGNIFYSGISPQPNTITTNPICGSQGAAVELQYLGSGKFMPVSSAGLIWAN